MLLGMLRTNLLLLTLIIAFQGAVSGADNTAAVVDKTAATVDTGKQIQGSGSDLDFVGKWVSSNLGGGALLFVISEIECHFYKNGNFTASVTYTDGQNDTMKGEFSVDKNYMFIVQSGKKDQKPYKLRYWFIDPTKTMLAIRDKNFGVTMTLTRWADAGDDSSSGGIFSDF